MDKQKLLTYDPLEENGQKLDRLAANAGYEVTRYITSAYLLARLVAWRKVGVIALLTTTATDRLVRQQCEEYLPVVCVPESDLADLTPEKLQVLIASALATEAE